MHRRPQVLIIGGGAIGLCSAYYLRRHGNDVTVIDSGLVGGPQSCSYGNAGFISPSGAVPLSEPGVIGQALKWMLDPESPFYIKLRLDYDLIWWLLRFARACDKKQCAMGTRVLRDLQIRSIRLFRELNGIDEISCGFIECGKLRIYNTPDGFDAGRRTAELITQIGGHAEILTSDQVREMVPEVPLEICGGVYNGEDAYVNPAEFIRQLRRLIEKMGVRVYSFCEVYEFGYHSGAIRKVYTTRGEFAPAEVVLAAGSWSAGLARKLNFKLPVQPGKGYSITIEKPFGNPRLPIMLSEGKIAVTPLGDTLRFAGTLELSGLDTSLVHRRLEAIMKTARRYMPALGKTRTIQLWRGLRPCTPDGIPFIGRGNTCTNLTIACGHAMIGLALAPITGKLVSQIINNSEPDVDLTPLRISRFHSIRR